MSLKDSFRNQQKNEGSTNFISYLDIKKSGLEKFIDKDKQDYKIDILPYNATDEQLPIYEKSGMTYGLKIYIHRDIGVNKGRYLCNQKMYGKPCAVCEWIKEQKEKGREWKGDLENYGYKERKLYYVLYEHQRFVFDSPYKTFEDVWKLEVEKREKKGKSAFPIYLNEADCYSLEFSTTDKKGIGRYVQFDFTDIEKYDEKNIKGLIGLEKLLIIPDQEKLSGIIEDAYQAPDETEDDNIETENNEKYYQEVIEKEEVKEEEPIKKKKKSFDTCPFGTKFGEEWDEYTHCDECVTKYPENYEKCKQASKG